MTRPAIKVEIVYAVKVTHVDGTTSYSEGINRYNEGNLMPIYLAIKEARRVSSIHNIGYSDNTEE